MTQQVDKSMNGLSQEVTSKKTTILFDATKNMTTPGAPRSVTLSAESANAFYSKEPLSGSAAESLKTAMTNAYAMVNSVCQSWDTLTRDRSSFEGLMEISAESANAMGESNRNLLHTFSHISQTARNHAAQALVLGSDPVAYIRSTESAHALRQRIGATAQSGGVVSQGRHDRRAPRGRVD